MGGKIYTLKKYILIENKNELVNLNISITYTCPKTSLGVTLSGQDAINVLRPWQFQDDDGNMFDYGIDANFYNCLSCGENHKSLLS